MRFELDNIKSLNLNYNKSLEENNKNNDNDNDYDYDYDFYNNINDDNCRILLEKEKIFNKKLQEKNEMSQEKIKEMHNELLYNKDLSR